MASYTQGKPMFEAVEHSGKVRSQGDRSDRAAGGYTVGYYAIAHENGRRGVLNANTILVTAPWHG